MHVASYNDNAIGFYERHGYIKTGKDVTGGVAALPRGKYIPEIEMLLPRQEQQQQAVNFEKSNSIPRHYVYV